MEFTALEIIPVLAAWRCWEYRYSFSDGRQVPHSVTTRSMLPVTIYTPVWRDTKQGAEFLFQEKKNAMISSNPRPTEPSHRRI